MTVTALLKGGVKRNNARFHGVGNSCVLGASVQEANHDGINCKFLIKKKKYRQTSAVAMSREKSSNQT